MHERDAQEVDRFTRCALTLLRAVADRLPPAQAAALRDCIDCVKRATGVKDEA